jgi:phenylalanyl-tRNA synthetase alpha chain
MAKNHELQKIIESLSPNERKILPFLKEPIEVINKKTNLDSTSILRALEFLSNKKLIELKGEKQKIVELELNGVQYLNKGLPERRLINLISEKKSMSIEDAQKESKLNTNEFKAAIGALKKKAMINLMNGRIILSGEKKDIAHKTLEEKFLESLPRNLEELEPEDKYALKNLQSRKNIINIRDKKTIEIHLTDLGEELAKKDISSKEMLELLTPSIIKNGSWKGKKFRRYDITSPVPKITGGKRHFVNQATDYARKIWLEMGFREMSGNMIENGFWVFDALFTAQDHPVREMQDTFFIKNKISKLPDKQTVKAIKDSHEGKIKGSKGWQYEWKEEPAKTVLLRTHTTSLSARTLKKIAESKEVPAKYFALGKCFRNETVDWSHGFEFNQTEGIVVDENANFRQLLGYLKEFFSKMGYEKIRIRPGYFAYTEPSLEIDVFHPIHKEWVELGGAGMFRPEVTIPFFGRHIPVLAWGPGFDRIIMEFFKITDLREMYKNNLNKLRDMKIWDK